MFNATVLDESQDRFINVFVKFYRDQKTLTTTCELKIGLIGENPGEIDHSYIGVAKKSPKDKFDKGVGHVVSLKRAIEAAGLGSDRGFKLDVFSAYKNWAIQSKIKTKVSLR